jgi:hypothetical protein
MDSAPSVTGGNPAAGRVLTWQRADLLSPHEAIERWRSQAPAALHEHEPEHHLEGLALMTVVAEWLTRWQPIGMHQAIVAGATPDQVAEAAGVSVSDVFERWERWAEGQRGLILGGRPSVSAEAYELVRARFAAAGARSLG